jgi:pyruvate dehydrogenase E2 component (dihydrolipoamide acetyltransferase)
MAEVIRMPKMSDTMEEGVIASWLKKEGDTVKAGDILAEIETDKATMELEAYEDGTLLHIGVKEKAAVPINALIAIIGEPGEDITGLLAASTSHPPTKQEDTATMPPLVVLSDDSTTHATPTAGTAQSSKQPHLFASPLAKRMAQEKGYELAKIQGTGEGGRIIKRDIECVTATTQPKEALPNTPLPPIIGEEAYEDVPISNMRKIIAKRLVESKLSAPHFYLTIDVAMDEVVAARASINAYAPIKVSFNDIIIKATAQAIWHGSKIKFATTSTSIWE